MRSEFIKLLESGLYHAEQFSFTDIDDIVDFFKKEMRYDCFCPLCNKESIFKSKAPVMTIGAPQHPIIKTIEAKEIQESIELFCSRDSTHRIKFYFKTEVRDEDTVALLKIGQYPSVADISNSDTKKYLNVLGKDKSKELNKAIGLFSHGIGIGSFIYLRRIFESLIEEAHREAIRNEDWSEEEYLKSRMHDRIGILKENLPEFLVQNKSIYSILSKGIHELSEEECLEMFPVVRTGIELILDEKIEQLERVKKLSEASKLISSLHEKYK